MELLGFEIHIEQLILLGCLLVAYPLAWFYYSFLLNLRQNNIKYFYLFFFGNLFVCLVYGPSSMWSIYLMILMVYFISKWNRAKKGMPLWCLIYLFIHLSIVHLYRQYGLKNPDALEHSIVLMILIIKLSSFSYDISDATLHRKRRISTSSKDEKESNREKREEEEEILRRMKMESLRKFPGLMEYLSFCFIFPGVLVGPAISFSDYRNFIQGGNEDQDPIDTNRIAINDINNLNGMEKVDSTIISTIPSPLRQASLVPGALAGRKRRSLKLFILSTLSLVLYFLFHPTFNIQNIISNDQISKPFWYRLLFLHISVFVERLKYYFVWCMAEGSLVLLGLGFVYDSKRNQGKWDGCSNVNLIKIETSSDVRQLVAEWNICTNKWLYKYIYRRIGDWYYSERRPGFRSSLVTYFISAFWHGFYPSYYLVFLSVALYTHFSRLIYKNFTWNYSRVSRKLITYIPNMIFIDYLTAPFYLYELELCRKYYKSWYSWGHWFMIIGIVILTIYSKMMKMAIFKSFSTTTTKTTLHPFIPNEK